MSIHPPRRAFYSESSKPRLWLHESLGVSPPDIMAMFSGGASIGLGYTIRITPRAARRLI